MATAKKVTYENFKPTTAENSLPVLAKQFNELVDVVNELEPADGTLVADTISESTSDSGVTVDGVLLKDNKLVASGGISRLASEAITEFTVLTTLTATEIVGSSAGSIGHASGASLVSAQGAGYSIELISAVCIYDFDTAAYTGGANDVVIAYGGGGAAITGIVTTAKLLGAASDKQVVFYPLAAAATDLASNTGLSIRGTAFTQPGTAAGVLRVYTTYRVITNGL